LEKADFEECFAERVHPILCSSSLTFVLNIYFFPPTPDFTIVQRNFEFFGRIDIFAIFKFLFGKILKIFTNGQSSCQRTNQPNVAGAADLESRCL